MNSVRESWKQIEVWLSANAPKIAGNLNPPASESEISAVEVAFGFAMPEEWRELYRVHNGINDIGNNGSLFCGMDFLPLERVLQQFVMDTEVSEEEAFPVEAADPGIRKEGMHHSKWIAFAHDWGRMLLRIDLDPSPGGKSGQVIFTDHDYDTVILMAPSLAHFLADFVGDLQAGRYFLNEESLKNGDEFLDCIPEIDVMNWSNSPKWKHLEA